MFFLIVKLATNATTHVDLTGNVLSTQFRLELFFFPKKGFESKKTIGLLIEVQVLNIFDRVPSSSSSADTCGVS